MSSEVGNLFVDSSSDNSSVADALLRAPLILIVYVGLWGVDVLLLKRYNIDIDFALSEGDGAAVNNPGNNSSPTTPSSKGDLLGPHGSPMMQGFEMRTFTYPEEGASLFNDEAGLPDPSQKDAESSSNPSSQSHSSSALSSHSFFTLSLSMFVLYYMSQLLWTTLLSGGSLGASFIFYAWAFAFLMYPSPRTTWARQKGLSLCSLCLRIIFPTKLTSPVPFAHVFIADGMCSLSKVFFDWGFLLVLTYYYPHAPPRDIQTILVPSLFAASPYFLRARQCLVTWYITPDKGDGMRNVPLLNTLKYMSSVLPIAISVAQKLTPNNADPKHLERSLLFFLVVNSSFTFTWDVIMDWGMGQNLDVWQMFCFLKVNHRLIPMNVNSSMRKKSKLNNERNSESNAVTAANSSSSKDKEKDKDRDSKDNTNNSFLRPRLRFGAMTSCFFILINLLLRCSWMLRYQPTLFNTNDQYVLFVQFAEVTRRALWNLLRIEWQVLCRQNHLKDLEKEKDVEFDSMQRSEEELKGEREREMREGMSMSMSGVVGSSSGGGAIAEEGGEREREGERGGSGKSGMWENKRALL